MRWLQSYMIQTLPINKDSTFILNITNFVIAINGTNVIKKTNGCICVIVSPE